MRIVDWSSDFCSSDLGKDMPIITYDLIEDADYIEIVCSPKALGSGRWAAMELFTFSTLETIETYILDVAIKAGSHHCPPPVMGDLQSVLLGQSVSVRVVLCGRRIIKQTNILTY